jgi:hypothetical protein
MTFFQRNLRFIAPLPWLLLAAMKLWQAIHVGGTGHYAVVVMFIAVAAMFYIGQRHVYLQRLQGGIGTSVSP